MATLNDLIPEICIETPKCHVGQIRMALQHTLRDFCRQTHYWQHTIEPITLLAFDERVPSTYLYEIPIPPDTSILGIRQLLYQGQAMPLKSTDWLDGSLGNWRHRSGEPWYVLSMSDRRVRFVPGSDAVRPQAVTGAVVLEPARRSNAFGDDLLHYDQGLIHGTLARLLLIGNRPWTDPARAQSCQIAYLDAVSDAKFHVLKDFSDGAETREQRSWL